ncbi:uncharacterized protein LOC117746901 isoform X2 [Cyclopterus lumpus]|uniref:uncharacterized protein LOC117746901 isoform X2 n=1 Tax=Cyclopterus lumpus TaxID=8103 RepID=UPI00148621F9|nr:uncharacterized protein LOC117746901 isoform X2 [Cyclopterus lumpus]
MPLKDQSNSTVAMKPAVDEMFPEGAGPYVDLDEAGGSTGLLMDLAANEKAVHLDFFNDPRSQDVAHITMHVHTLLLLTSDLTNCQTHRKAAQQTPQQVHSQIFLLLSPYTTPTFSTYNAL